MPDLPTDEAPQTFEGALAHLQQIVHELEEGELGLESSLSRFEQGVHLLRRCYRILEEAEQRIEILTGADAAGNPVTEPFDASATFAAGEKPTRKPSRRTVTKKAEAPAGETDSSPESASREDGGLF